MSRSSIDPTGVGSSRRRFLTQAALLGGATVAAPRRLFAAANDRLRVGFIATGGRGAANLNAMVKTGRVEVTAICDVDEKALELTSRQHPAARRYVDFRKLYDAEANRLDAVVVSTAEHTHAFATMPALRNGLHVYCEKPLAYNVDETRQITEVAADAGVVTQMGTQIHASSNYRRVVELIRSGAIGTVSEAHVWVSRAWGLQSEEEAIKNKDRLYVRERPQEAMTPPETLAWDLWLGPAPERPYHDVYFPGPNWYRWWDFGNGTMSDLGSHWNDLPYWALELDAPRTVESFGIPPHPEIAPASMTAVYEYGPRGDRPAVRMTWYQGTHKPKPWTDREIPQWPNGVLFVGSNGMLLADYRKYQLLPEERYEGFEPPEPFIPDSPGHHEEWVAACFGEGTTGSPFSYAGPLTEANHLGNVAYRVGKKIEWDPKSMRAIGCPEADPFLKRTPRDGWSLG